ncbi:pyrroline-5-carboxylate reductase family protein [Fructilactobacillus florum]|uniref:Pyrroline-5-carboxylate reductase n=1 Tax=Fructilactobacillus florum DSM 22689 = JCM 16035 TaxID=1423745 RepID=A0A0R2CMA0_9LACO|nr:pyrroline-5-carboxylate reductase [Fructilactobacillus florum]KRM92304.1 hypothetical protein FC87_GL000435 [Fructilactobacillus florum DSM 22689 = JCM 16035]
MKIGILGAGSMGSAIIRGLTTNYDADHIFVKIHHESAALASFQKELGFHFAETATLSEVDILFVATPAPTTLTILKDLPLASHTIIISAAQGVAPAEIQKLFPQNSVLAIIPNIPVAVNAGTIALERSQTVTPKDQQTAMKVLSSLGSVNTVAAEQLGILGTVAGCGPAFVDIFLSALADSAVQNGLDRKTAYQVAASMVAGSAKMALTTGTNPAILKDQVTSPGGSTIKGVLALDRHGFSNAVNEAINAANE